VAAGIVGSNPVKGTGVCLCVSVCVYYVLCCPVYVEAFATG
jgi:hypothetical protein